MTELMVLASPMASASLTSSEPIVINGDADLASQASLKEWAGDGSAENPYMIADLTFDAGSGTAISISGTSLFVTIKNCTITNSNYGIDLSRSSNVTIMGNTIQGMSGQMGICLYDTSSNNTISDNTCYGNWNGIYLDSSSNNTISNNTCNGNLFGIYLDSSSNNTLTNNRCNDSYIGIWLSYSENSEFSNNTGSNDYYGIYIECSGDSIIINNTFRDCADGAICLDGSNDSLVSNNTCIGGTYGIWVFLSDRCTVSNNTCVDMSVTGIYLDNSAGFMDGNTLINCSFSLWADPLDVQEYVDVTKITSTNTVNGLPVYFLKNTDLGGASVPSSGIGEIILLNVTDAIVSGLSLNYGGVIIGISSYIVIENNVIDNATNSVCMFLSNHCIIDDNVFINAPWEGVFVGSSSYVIVSNNTCVGNDEGINLEESSYVIVSNNTCNGNDDDGIDLYGSSYVIVSNNTCNGNANGIYLDSSNNSAVIDNSMVGSTAYGIYLQTSSNNTLVGNTIVGSADYGIYVTGSSSILIYDNALINNNGAMPEYNSSHIQAYDDGTNAWNSTTRGNFWVDWRSTERYLIDGGSMADERPYYIEDTTPPEVNITNPQVGAWYNTTAINVTWTASDEGSRIANMSVSLDGGAWIEVTNQYYELTALAEGQHNVSVRVYDHAGNYRIASKVFNIETELPSITITEPANDSTVGTAVVQVAWTASSASTIGKYWISVDGGEFVDVGQNTSRLLSLANGQHVVTVKVRDFAGNWNSTSVEFEVFDNVAPTATISPSGDDVAIGTVITVTFSEAMNESSVSIVVNGVTGTISWNGNIATFTPSSDLAYDTEYSVTVSGEDLAGNNMTAEASFTTLKNEGTVSGTVKDADGNAVANATVTLSNGMSTTTDVNGYFEFVGVPTGSYTLNVTKDGFVMLSQTVNAVAGQTTDLAALSMTKSASRSDDGSMLLIVGLVGVVIAAILIIGFLFYRKKDEKK